MTAPKPTLSVCGECDRPIRPHNKPVAMFPGTIAAAAKDLCINCYRKRRGVRAKVPVSRDEPSVLVRVDLRPSTFKVWTVEAERRGVTVAELLSAWADRAVKETS